MALNKKEIFERKVLEERVKAAEAQANIYRGRVQQKEMGFRPTIENISIQDKDLIKRVVDLMQSLNSKMDMILKNEKKPEKKGWW